MHIGFFFCCMYIYLSIDLAYKTVLHSYGLDSNPSTEEEENSDLEMMEVSATMLNKTIEVDNNCICTVIWHAISV